MVFLSSANDRPLWVGEVKWSDRAAKNFRDETRAMDYLMGKHPTVKHGFFTTRTHESVHTLRGRRIDVWPTAVYCYMVGKNATSPYALGLKMPHLDQIEDEEVEAA